MFLSKYGVARDIYIPMVKRAVVDFAVGADWTPAAGDVKISKDGGAAANVTTLPTAIAMGNGAVWKFPLSATEMQAAQVAVTVVDAATKAVEDQAFIVQTFGHASAQIVMDLSQALPTNFSLLVIDANGHVRIQSNVKKNQALAGFLFLITDSTNHNPATGKTVAATRSLDGAAFAACANSVVEVANGWYKLDLAAADLNGNNVGLRFTASGCDDLAITIITEP